ncbi:hypothetical protein FHW68_000316 [Pseudomonas sp. Tn43]|nr:hypothetical protein [Pseudomonas sp. Tn43]
MQSCDHYAINTFVPVILHEIRARAHSKSCLERYAS